MPLHQNASDTSPSRSEANLTTSHFCLTIQTPDRCCETQHCHLKILIFAIGFKKGLPKEFIICSGFKGNIYFYLLDWIVAWTVLSG